MLLNPVLAPETYPVSVSEAKEALILDFDDDIVLVDALIATATDMVEGMVGRPLVAQTWAMAVGSVDRCLNLPKPPVRSVESITYFDADNVQQTANVADFYLFSDLFSAWIEPKPGVSWPSLADRADALTVTFVCGYGAASAVPPALKRAILMLVVHLYEHRAAAGDKMHEMPMGVSSMISLYRNGWIG